MSFMITLNQLDEGINKSVKNASRYLIDALTIGISSHQLDIGGFKLLKKEKLLEKITTQYLESGDFNGLPLSSCKSEKENIIALVREGKIEVNFGDKHPNPHIKALELDDKDAQILKIESIGFEYACAYSTKEHLKKVVNVDEFKDRPFTLKIALGEPQLNYAVFDLSVLESYVNDPRYIYSIDDIQGFISVSDEYYQSSQMKPSDKIVLQSFGFCYEKNTMNRAVAVFYRYLADLTPEHQQIWNFKVLAGDYILHPDYARSSGGDFYQRASIFVAFIEELHTINEFSKLMVDLPFSTRVTETTDQEILAS